MEQCQSKSLTSHKKNQTKTPKEDNFNRLQNRIKAESAAISSVKLN